LAWDVARTPPAIDVIVLTRGLEPLRSDLLWAIRRQRGISPRVYRVWGRAEAGESSIAAIVRARNLGKSLGKSPWIMFLDDDVIPDLDCGWQLWQALQTRPELAAAAADYACERSRVTASQHVGLGATLFRREVLNRVHFRHDASRCECLCCAEDLARIGLGMAYVAPAQARHVRRAGETHVRNRRDTPLPSHQGSTGRILVAFDRRHLHKFLHQFLASLRNLQNREVVTAVGYGLLPSEQRRLRHIPGVELIPLPANGILPPVRRLRDFQKILACWPPRTPVAYWDAGDVVFQSSLAELWKLVAQHPERLLACAEPQWYPQNPAVASWTLSIGDPQSRRAAFALLTCNPFLNSGFAAGTAATLDRYFRAADWYLNSAILRGTSDWGDQTALNLYCHRHPERWLRIDEAWNYCVHDRPRGSVRVTADARVVSRLGHRICVVHGNAKSLRQLELTRRSMLAW
jgi:hypothetical protein